MSRKDSDTIRSEIIADITSAFPNITTRVGSVVRDVLINPVVNQLDSAYNDIERVSLAQSPATAEGSDLIALGETWGVYRKGAIKSLGSVLFFRKTAPNTNINIPAGTIVETSASSQGVIYRFKTIQSVTFLSSISSSYFNALTNRYEISAAAESEMGGGDYNIAIGAIKKLTTSISGIDGATNTSDFTGGADQESLTSLSDRISAKFTGNNLGTYNGYYQSAIAYPSVADVLIISAGETGMLRKPAGAVDIYIKGSSPVAAEDTYTVTGTYPPDITVLHQPVITTSTSTIVSSEGIELIKDTDWEWTKDTGIYAGSIKGLDKIHWLTSKTGLGTLTISYMYNGLVTDLQNTLNNPSYKNLCADVLIKAAAAVYVNVATTIRISSGYSQSSVVASIQSAIAQLLATYTLGVEVQKSDIVSTINGVLGVEDVSSTLTTLSDKYGLIPVDTFGNIDIPPSRYATAGDTATVNVVS